MLHVRSVLRSFDHLRYIRFSRNSGAPVSDILEHLLMKDASKHLLEYLMAPTKTKDEVPLTKQTSNT